MRIVSVGALDRKLLRPLPTVGCTFQVGTSSAIARLVVRSNRTTITIRLLQVILCRGLRVVEMDDDTKGAGGLEHGHLGGKAGRRWKRKYAGGGEALERQGGTALGIRVNPWRSPALVAP